MSKDKGSAPMTGATQTAPASFTAGPWAVNPTNAQVDAFDTGVPVPVCQLLWPTELRSEAETEANGHLIAAAPELLACLVAAVHGVDGYGGRPNWLPHARKAIARAAGAE